MEAAAPFTDLQNCLARKTIPQLRRLAANLHLNGTSKLRKNELIGVIRNDLLRPERLEAVLYGLEEPEWILFQKCAAADAYPLKTAAQGMEGILPFLGYLQAFQHENRQFYVVPKDVRAIYQELATASFLARKKRDNLIHSYAMAAVNPPWRRNCLLYTSDAADE